MFFRNCNLFNFFLYNFFLSKNFFTKIKQKLHKRMINLSTIKNGVNELHLEINHKNYFIKFLYLVNDMTKTPKSNYFWISYCFIQGVLNWSGKTLEADKVNKNNYKMVYKFKYKSQWFRRYSELKFNGLIKINLDYIFETI